MPVDETLKLKQESLGAASKQNQDFIFMTQVYNIDDMDDGSFMCDHRLEGVYTVMTNKDLDLNRPGTVYVNDICCGEAIIAADAFSDAYIIGLPVRKAIFEYDSVYQIRYENVYTKDGKMLEPFCFALKTLGKIEPGTYYPEHDELVLQAARESIVLLKNENHALPLSKGQAINAFGKGAATFRLGCVGAGKINPRYGIRFQEGIEKYSSLKLNQSLFHYYRSTESNALPCEEELQKAREFSDTAVVVITRGTGESMDNEPIAGDYYLTQDEKILLETVSELFDKTVVVLNTGYPIEMGWALEERIDAVLWCGLPGMAGGKALAEILEGAVCPSGRLPDTWPVDYYDLPSARNFCSQKTADSLKFGDFDSYIDTVYEEGLYVGYRYFTTFDKKCAYPFGHGLSYTTFSMTCESVQVGTTAASLIIKVKNIGEMAGCHSVLVYAEIPDGRLEQPLRRLVAFGKTHLLQPGEEEVLELSVESMQLKSYDEENAQWVIEEGVIRLYAGGSVQETNDVGEIRIAETVVLEKVKNCLRPPIDITELSKHAPDTTYPTGKYTGWITAKELPHRVTTSHTPMKSLVSAKNQEELITFPMLMENPDLIDSFVLQLDDYELCRMSIGGRTGWSPEENGFAGMLYNEEKIAKYEIPDYYMADGNNGLNLYIATIGFPVSNSMCATFNVELLYQEGRALGVEAIDNDLHCILAPAMNLHRNPLCGRHAEYFSEDPYLAGRMGGMESKGIESMGIASVMKHFFANNAENLRTHNQSILTERTARELYLRVFEVAMQVHVPTAMMTGYNPANGLWCTGDEELLQEILRNEWHFEGYVMTDWGASGCCPAAEAAQAGNSWIAPGGMDDSEVLPMMEALKSGKLDRERLRENVRNMYATLIKYKPL